MNFIDGLFTKFFDSKSLAKVMDPVDRAMDSDRFGDIFFKFVIGFLILTYLLCWGAVFMAIFEYEHYSTSLIFAGILVFFFFLGRWCYLHILKE